MTSHDDLFKLIQDLVMRHSPSGVEQEVDDLIKARFAAIDVEIRSDAGGNLVARIPGSGGGSIAISAHKDEIGAIVTAVQDQGRLRIRRLGGSYPWIYGEGVVDVLGDRQCISGVLSFGSRHISHASPQHAHLDAAPVRWTDVWVETKLSTAELAEAGVRPGSRVVVGRHRKAPFRMKDYIASYTLDDKAAVAILLELAKRVNNPLPDVYLVATAKEEVGALGAMYFTQRQSIDALIALEIAPLAPEYSIEDSVAPVLLAEDSYGLYDTSLNEAVRRAAASAGVPLQLAVVSAFGSDGSIAMKAGHVPKAACLGFPTQNTHGYEIAHLGAIANCVTILEAVCKESFVGA